MARACFTGEIACPDAVIKLTDYSEAEDGSGLQGSFALENASWQKHWRMKQTIMFSSAAERLGCPWIKADTSLNYSYSMSDLEGCLTCLLGLGCCQLAHLLDC